MVAISWFSGHRKFVFFSLWLFLQVNYTLFIFTMADYKLIFVVVHYYRSQLSWGKVMFLQVCVIVFTGGEYLTRYNPPGPGRPTLDQVDPLPDQVHPPPWTR